MQKSEKISAGIVGATGYTGIELVYWLSRHPCVSLDKVSSESQAGQVLSDYLPGFNHIDHLRFEPFEPDNLQGCQVVFFATPHGFAMQHVASLLDQGIKVIDLSADYRLSDIETWEAWYGVKHQSKELIDEAAYGLTEIHRAQIKQARLVANPGCYPTAIQLGYYPLIKHGLIKLDNLIADAKSGASGAGKKAAAGLMLTELSQNFHAYKTEGHRHLPEILEQLNRFAESHTKSRANYQKQPLDMVFTPHLLPINRGILATLYADLVDEQLDIADIRSVYQQAYENEPFVKLLKPGVYPQLKNLERTNACHINIFKPPASKKVIVQSAIDNLAKGASGQAVQNMNLLFDLPETMGLF